MVELTIESIRVSLMNYQRVVILKEKESDRYLPIWIGPAEADAIAVRLQEVAVARPLTHDLLRSIIDSLGASVDYVIVNDLSNDTFFARIMLQIDGRVMEIDSRPSDAIALAVRVQVPIYADESVLEKAGVKLDQEGQTLEAITGETGGHVLLAPGSLLPALRPLLLISSSLFLLGLCDNLRNWPKRRRG